MHLIDLHIIVIALLVAYAAILPGIFLVLRGMALMSDAISHAILPGIVLMFLYVPQLHSPLLICAATLAGFVTVLLTEFLIATRCLKKDAAIGLVFPLFFSVGIILISLYARSVHLDIDMVLMGETLLAPFNNTYLCGYNLGPHALWTMGFILLINSLFVSYCYKELKLTIFDQHHAHILGFSPLYIHYILMSLTSITCVGAFDVVGSIVVVALMITPPATAYLMCDTLDRLLSYSLMIGTFAVIIGYAQAVIFDVSIAGSIATANGLLFMLSLLFAPKKGIYRQTYLQKKQQMRYALPLLCNELDHNEPRSITQISEALGWSKTICATIITQALKNELIVYTSHGFLLSKAGAAFLVCFVSHLNVPSQTNVTLVK